MGQSRPGQDSQCSESFIQTTAVDNNNNLNETKLDLKEEARFEKKYLKHSHTLLMSIFRALCFECITFGGFPVNQKACE